MGGQNLIFELDLDRRREDESGSVVWLHHEIDDGGGLMGMRARVGTDIEAAAQLLDVLAGHAGVEAAPEVAAGELVALDALLAVLAPGVAVLVRIDLGARLHHQPGAQLKVGIFLSLQFRERGSGRSCGKIRRGCQNGGVRSCCL